MRAAALKSAETRALTAIYKEHSMADKKADLAGPGIGDYLELEKILPADYSSAVTERDAEGPLRGEALYRREPLQRN
jgi:hypothetical protein